MASLAVAHICSWRRREVGGETGLGEFVFVTGSSLNGVRVCGSSVTCGRVGY